MIPHKLSLISAWKYQCYYLHLRIPLVVYIHFVSFYVLFITSRWLFQTLRIMLTLQLLNIWQSRNITFTGIAKKPIWMSPHCCNPLTNHENWRQTIGKPCFRWQASPNKPKQQVLPSSGPCRQGPSLGSPCIDSSGTNCGSPSSSNNFAQVGFEAATSV